MVEVSEVRLFNLQFGTLGYANTVTRGEVGMRKYGDTLRGNMSMEASNN